MMTGADAWIGILIINIASFLMFGLDKTFAKERMWRIPESVLLGTAVLGGSIGAYLGMQVFRHKTRKPMFRIGIPVIIILHTVLVIWYCSVWVM
jgi:uncharacterized membrane protein YsdA (DUF1294 family)